MQKMGLKEFGKLFADSKPELFSFLTDNQKDTYTPTLKLNMSFDKMIVSPATCQICFRDSNRKHSTALEGGDSLCFNMVKEVRVQEYKPCVGTVFSIVCENLGELTIYTMLAD